MDRLSRLTCLQLSMPTLPAPGVQLSLGVRMHVGLRAWKTRFYVGVRFMVFLGIHHHCFSPHFFFTLLAGANDQGQLGDGTNCDANVPVRIDTGTFSAWSSLTAGHSHTCGIIAEQESKGYCWGRCWFLGFGGQQMLPTVVAYTCSVTP